MQPPLKGVLDRCPEILSMFFQTVLYLLLSPLLNPGDGMLERGEDVHNFFD